MNLAASPFDAVSASQVRSKDAYLDGLKDEQQGNLTHEKEQVSEESDDEPWYYKPAAQIEKACGRPLAGETTESSSAFQKSQKNKDATMDHFFVISPQRRPCMDAVFDIVKKIYGRESNNPMKDLDVNVAIWGVFMNATLGAAVRLGDDHDANLRNLKK